MTILNFGNNLRSSDVINTFFETKIKNKTKSSRPIPRLSFLSSRVETNKSPGLEDYVTAEMTIKSYDITCF